MWDAAKSVGAAAPPMLIEIADPRFRDQIREDVTALRGAGWMPR